MIVSLEQTNQNIQPEKVSVSHSTRETVKNTGTVSAVSVDLYVNGNNNDAYKGAPKNKEDILNVLKEKGYSCTLVNARFVKPIDEENIKEKTSLLCI